MTITEKRSAGGNAEVSRNRSQRVGGDTLHLTLAGGHLTQGNDQNVVGRKDRTLA